MLLAVAIVLALISISCAWYIIRSHDKLQEIMYKQQETIQRLIIHEPVTYQEVGKEAPKAKLERYSAWAGETVDINDE